MREHSTYDIVCICGKRVETRDAEFVCPDCGREGDIHWGRGYVPEPEPPEPKEGPPELVK